MREIKFRQWMHKHWHFFAFTDGMCSGVQNATLSRYPIMQYTGLKDKNGREIYEGDIVKYSDQLDEGIAIIEQHKYPDIIPYLVLRYAVNSPGTGDYNFDYLHGGPSHVYEVIGNIYENPELLK